MDAVLERDLVEGVADPGRQVGAGAADGGGAVRVLHVADELAALVAVDLRLVPGDQCRLARKDLLRARLVGRRDRVPAVRPRRVEEEPRNDRDGRERLERIAQVGRASVLERGEPRVVELVVFGLLAAPPAAEVGDVARLRRAIGYAGPRASASPLQVATDEEMQLQ